MSFVLITEKKHRVIKKRTDKIAIIISFSELLSNLVFEGSRSCGDLVCGCGFNSVFEPDACDDFSEVIKAA